MIYLDCLSLEDVQKYRKWRNQLKGIYRTPFKITGGMQEDWYFNTVNNRNSNNRYFAIKQKGGEFIGVGGITDIQWENGIGEIALTLGPDFQQKGYGENAVDLLLTEAFNDMRLQNIYGECYKCNPALKFWKKMISKYGGYQTVLPARKYFNGQFWDSVYFSFSKKGKENED